MIRRATGGALARWLQALAAVVAGNAVYFVVVSPHLPAAWRHRPYTLDAGLVLDFLICLAFYAALARLARRGRRG